MLNLLKNVVGETAAPFIFLILFLVIVGAALWLTPRLARWLDRKSSARKGFYDDMLTEDPKKTQEENEEKSDV